jgi:hypothetical protein
LTPEKADLLIPPKIPSLQAAAVYSDKMKAKSRATSSGGEFLDEIDISKQFQGEFWHSRGAAENTGGGNMFGGNIGDQPRSTGFGAPQFKPRTKLYKRRQQNQS